MISYTPPVQPPAPVVPIVRDASCGDALGCFDGTTIHLSADARRWTLEHERGHVMDAERLTDAQRAAFSSLPWVRRSVEPDAGWYGYDESGAYFYGYAEVFADAYATCRLRRLPQPRPRHGVIVGKGDRMGTYGYDPGTNNRQRRTCRRIARWLG